MKKAYIIILILSIFLTMFFLYNKLYYMDVFVKFDDIEPFERQMPVYFKGFKIGKTTKIFPDDEFKNTYLKLKLKRIKLKFPSNVSVCINAKKSGGYVNIVYPNEPTIRLLKENDIIIGQINHDIKELLESRLTGEDVESILDGATGLIDNASVAVQNLSDLFIEIRELISDSRADIKVATNNVALTTKNLRKMSEKVNNSIDRESISNSINNVEYVSKNLKEISSQIDKISVPIINSTLCEVNSASKNVKDISSGIKNSLNKNFGLMRFLFGKSLKED